MKKQLQAVIEALPQLTQDELAEVANRIGFLRRGQTEQPTGTDADFVLSCLARTMSSLGVEHTSAARLAEGPHYAGFKKKVPALIEFANRAVPTRVQQQALLSLGFEYLYKNLTQMGLPASSRLVMDHAHRLPSVIDSAFPGYARAGLLHWVVRAENHATSDGHTKREHSGASRLR